MKRIFTFAIGFAILILELSLGDEQFISLFNGKDLTGRGIPSEVSAFGVIDDVMIAELPNESDIFINEEFVKNIFLFEFLLSEVENSGVLIHCIPENPWGTGVEV